MKWWVLVAMAVGLGACGGGGRPPPDVVLRTPEQKQCDVVMEAWCPSALECAHVELSETERTEELDLCVDVAKGTCDATDAVEEERYDECLSSVQTLGAGDCQAVQMAVRDGTDVPMPASCSELFVSE